MHHFDEGRIVFKMEYFVTFEKHIECFEKIETIWNLEK